MKITCFTFAAVTVMLGGCAPLYNVPEQPFFYCAPYNFVPKKCVAVPMASEKEDRLAKAFPAPPPDKARVYIVRRFKVEYQRTSDLFINGAAVAALGPETYLMLDLIPGQYLIRARTLDETDRQLTALPGQSYFVSYSLRRLFGKVTGTLDMADEKKGQALVSASKRARTGNNVP